MTNITWACPKCGQKNLDAPELTAVPMCSQCETEFFWEQIPEANGYFESHPYLDEEVSE